ncbi:hypothetical protein ACIA5G_14925 [Amycolatopsis sp. NPDC051758]|uniref:hypothetical protein n=1 Tax=Amycolatopsis sp. NPDC051758 TaxID=3363935 RepID=UPI0037AEC704
MTEALTNVRRHLPEATEVSVSARIVADDLVLGVRNDGVPASPLPSPGEFGIIGMAERLAMLGGSLTAGRESGSRWRVEARLPLGAEGTRFGSLPRRI